MQDRKEVKGFRERGIKYRGEVRKTVNVVEAFILGCAVGMYAYRQVISIVLGKNPTTKCDYCQFRMWRGKEPFPQEKMKRK